LYSLVIAVS